MGHITELFTKHFMSIAPAVTVKVTPHHGGQGYVTPIDSIGYKPLTWLIRRLWSSSYSSSFWYSYCSFVEKIKKQNNPNGFGLEQRLLK
jgi:hypothetical protein